MDQAWPLIEEELVANPNNPLALLVASHTMHKAKRVSVAYSLAQRVTVLAPERAEGWINLGRCADDLWRPEEAIECYHKALGLIRFPAQKVTALNNLAAVLLQNGRFREAEPYCRQGLEIKPDDRQTLHNLGLCQLARREWAEGWRNYSNSVGGPARLRTVYNDEPHWDGTKGLKLALTGEQGLGDEISFASVIPEVIRDSKQVVIDCDPRLAGLFQRSFPGAKVYGTRAQKDALPWAEEYRSPDASCSFGEVAKFYRNRDSDFPGTPFLTPCPDRVTMWKGLFATKTRPVIGIAWTGGLWHTGSLHRKVGLDELLPIFEAVPGAHWVSLQYKDAGSEIAAFREKHPEVDLVQYRYGTLTKDYDDTAALVASCDMVVCIQTAVAHLAGALGTPVWVMLPKNSQWRYGEAGRKILWYDSLTVFRQEQRGEWAPVIGSVAKELAKKWR